MKIGLGEDMTVPIYRWFLLIILLAYHFMIYSSSGQAQSGSDKITIDDMKKFATYNFNRLNIIKGLGSRVGWRSLRPPTSIPSHNLGNDNASFLRDGHKDDPRRRRPDNMAPIFGFHPTRPGRPPVQLPPLGGVHNRSSLRPLRPLIAGVYSSILLWALHKI